MVTDEIKQRVEYELGIIKNMGFADYFDKGNISIVEWPQIAGEFLEKRKTITVKINFTENDGEREIIIERH